MRHGGKEEMGRRRSAHDGGGFNFSWVEFGSVRFGGGNCVDNVTHNVHTDTQHRTDFVELKWFYFSYRGAVDYRNSFPFDALIKEMARKLMLNEAENMCKRVIGYP